MASAIAVRARKSPNKRKAHTVPRVQALQNFHSISTSDYSEADEQAQFLARRCLISLPYARIVLGFLQEGRRHG